MKRIIIILAILISSINGAYSEKILIPMDLAQSDHLKAYGIVYWTLKLPQNVKVIKMEKVGHQGYVENFSKTLEILTEFVNL